MIDQLEDYSLARIKAVLELYSF